VESAVRSLHSGTSQSELPRLPKCTRHLITTELLFLSLPGFQPFLRRRPQATLRLESD